MICFIELGELWGRPVEMHPGGDSQRSAYQWYLPFNERAGMTIRNGHYEEWQDVFLAAKVGMILANYRPEDTWLSLAHQPTKEIVGRKPRVN
jgi:hypothetical protein